MHKQAYIKFSSLVLILVLLAPATLAASSAPQTVSSTSDRIIYANHVVTRMNVDHLWQNLYAGQQSVPAAAAHGPRLNTAEPWSGPTQIVEGYRRWPHLNHAGDRAVFLDTSVYGDKNNRPVMYVEYVDGSWSSPVVIATNGAYDDTLGFQPAPQNTHPVISADGNVIAYLGYAGLDPEFGSETYAIYIVDREADGWGTPTQLPTGLGSHYYRVDLGADGNTVVYTNYPYLEAAHVYVSQREAGVWGAPVRVSGPVYGCFDPTVSADGTRIACALNNGWLGFIERIGDTWLSVQQLTGNDGYLQRVEHPHISADGNSIVYWLVDYVEDPPVIMAVSQDLYLVRREGWGWSAPVKMTATSVLPHSFGEPPAINAGATRAVYVRPVRQDDTNISTFLEWIEWSAAGWSAPTALTAPENDQYDVFANLSGDGQTLLFYRYSVYERGLHVMQTTQQPPVAPVSPVRAAALITPNGGILSSQDDATTYVFPSGAFTETVLLLHTGRLLQQLPTTSPLASSRHAFDVTAVYSSTGQPAQIAPGQHFTITIEPLDRGALIVETLALWWWDEAGVAWSQTGITTTVSADGGRLTAQVSHLSLFAVLGETRRVYLPLVWKEM